MILENGRIYNLKPLMGKLMELGDFYILDDAVFKFMTASLQNRELSWKELLNCYDGAFGPLQHVTPNGMVVPKRNTVLEYNLVVKAFANVIQRLGISDLIDSWHVPLNVRFKSSCPSTLNLGRAHPTEHPHSDSWAGESTESVTVHIPIAGDWSRNYVKMFYPSDEFQEEWLGPRSTYAEGAEAVARHYTPIDYKTAFGSLSLMDFATLHASTREPGCGPRVSIDTTFVLKKKAMAEKLHEWRAGERASDAVLHGIGETHLFHFPDAPDKQVDVGSGFKHPTNLRLVELLRSEP